MTVYHAIKRLLDSDKDISFSQRVAIVDIIESLKNCNNCLYDCNMLTSKSCNKWKQSVK